MFRMRHATGITLVLMGGGLAGGLAYWSMTAECREARANKSPDAERLCERGPSSVRPGRSGPWDTAFNSADHHGSDRGGFGHTARYASAGG